MEIPALVELEFETYNAAEEYIHQHARDNSYALSQGPEREDKRSPPTIRRVDFRCNKGGKIRNQGIRRSSGSRITECPFDLCLMRTDYVTGRRKISVHDLHYNRPPSNNLRQHPLYRKPIEEEENRIDQLTIAGVPPRMVVSALRTEIPQTLV